MQADCRDGHVCDIALSVCEAAVPGTFLKASNTGAGDGFGVSMSMSGDTLAVGAFMEGGNGNNTRAAGAVYIFGRTEGGWKQEAYLRPSNPGALDQFGISVSLLGDRLAVGAYLEDSTGSGVNPPEQDNGLSDSGAVYIFERVESEWTQVAHIKGVTPRQVDHFGSKVALSEDTLVVGISLDDSSAEGEADGPIDSGAVEVLRLVDEEWRHEALLKAPIPDIDDNFGFSLGISGDTIVVGARREDSDAVGVDGDASNNNAAGSGAAYVFRRVDNVWGYEAYLKASNTEPDDRFGLSVAIAGDTIVVGSDQEGSKSELPLTQSDNQSPSAGAAYVFHRTGSSWRQEAFLKGSNSEADDHFGYSLALSDTRLVVGAIGNDLGEEDSGAAYLFERVHGQWAERAFFKATAPGKQDALGTWVAVDGETIVSGAPWQSSGEGADGTETHDCADQDCFECFKDETCETCEASTSCSYYSGAVYVFE